MTKRDYVYQSLREEILTRRLHSGEKLIVKKLADKYEMSGIPVREALNMLESDGLVENSPYTGFIVSRIDFDKCVEYSLIRMQLECLAIRFSVVCLTDESIIMLEELLSSMRENMLRNDIESFADDNEKFHDACISFAPCKITISMMEDIRYKSYSHRMLRLFPERMDVSLKDHEDLIAAMKENNVELAARQTYHHKLSFLLDMVTSIKYNLLKPSYLTSPLLQEYFSPEELEHRNDLVAKMDRWSSILSQFQESETAQ